MLLAVCQEFGIENEIIPRIAFFFGGGIGNSGSVCGAVSGAVMALGLVKERPTKMDEMLPTLSLAGEFRRRFEAEMGTINCRELTGKDFSTAEGVEKYMSSDIPMKVCFPAAGAAYRLVVDLLNEALQSRGT